MWNSVHSWAHRCRTRLTSQRPSGDGRRRKGSKERRERVLLPTLLLVLLPGLVLASIGLPPVSPGITAARRLVGLLVRAHILRTPGPAFGVGRALCGLDVPLKPVRDDFLGASHHTGQFLQEVELLQAQPVVVGGQVGDGLSLVPDAPGSADPVDVRIDILREVVVHDERDVFDVEPSGCNIRRDEDVDLARAEAAEVRLALRLVEVSVEGTGVHALVIELFIEPPGCVLGVGEDQHAVFRRFRRSLRVEPIEQLDELLVLLRRVNPL
mmetsp:Transcript_18965/g.49235  ORF Transcript_18965/g.49235 Transcript_18965/m.49235 type:complete len:268 (-) Transcript_18965:1055-1858(-)